MYVHNSHCNLPSVKNLCVQLALVQILDTKGCIQPNYSHLLTEQKYHLKM